MYHRVFIFYSISSYASLTVILRLPGLTSVKGVITSNFDHALYINSPSDCLK
jgi:hypothetical protein